MRRRYLNNIQVSTTLYQHIEPDRPVSTMSNFENARNAFIKAAQATEASEPANSIKKVASLFESGQAGVNNKENLEGRQPLVYNGPKVGKVASLFSKENESKKEVEEVEEPTASERFANAARRFGSTK